MIIITDNNGNSNFFLIITEKIIAIFFLPGVCMIYTFSKEH